MPEEDSTKYPLISLILQEFYREILTVADEKGGKLDNRVVMFLDEIGTIPKIQNMEMMFSASRSRRVSIVAIIQSFAQLEKIIAKKERILSLTTASWYYSVALRLPAAPRKPYPVIWAIRQYYPALSVKESKTLPNPCR